MMTDTYPTEAPLQEDMEQNHGVTLQDISQDNDESYASDDTYEYEYDDVDDCDTLETPLLDTPTAPPWKRLKTTGLDDDDDDNDKTHKSLTPREEEKDHYHCRFYQDAAICPRCNKEAHEPLRDCRTVAAWMRRRDELPTVRASVLRACCQRHVRELARGLRLTVREAGVLCRRHNWRLHDILVHLARLQPEAVAHYLTSRMGPGQTRAFLANFDGDATRDYLEDALHELDAEHRTRTTTLGNQREENPRPNPRRMALEDDEENAAMERMWMRHHDIENEIERRMRHPNVGNAETRRRRIRQQYEQYMPGRAQASIERAREAPRRHGGTHSCPICLEDGFAHQDVMSMACGHTICLTCWRGFIDAMLNDGNQAALQTTCPIPDCRETVTEVEIEQIAPERLSDFENIQLHAFVQANGDTLRWCPGPDCGFVAVRPGQEMFEEFRYAFLCKNCKSNFCFHCGQEPHEGACPAVGNMQNNNDEAARGGAEGRLARGEQGAAPAGGEKRNNNNPVKKCPRCRVDIEKTGGCNRMTCKCGHHFCWLCLADYVSYDSHSCGRRRRVPTVQGDNINLDYVNATLLEGTDIPDSALISEQLNKFLRFMHYYNRYFAHHRGQRFAERQCPCLEGRAVNYTLMVGFTTGTETDFIRQANETLVASRRVLKYTYCSAYQMQANSDDDTETCSHPGYLQLERLERFTEELSEISENALCRQDRVRVLDLISVVTKSMKAVADFEDYAKF